MSGHHKHDIGAIIRRGGVSFRVWAPFADNVAVTGSFNEWGETPMASEGDGYWHVMVAGARAGQEYKFIIRRGTESYWRNDPRALYFTITAGSSVIVNQDFDWDDDDFVPPPLEQQVLYELHIGTFARPDEATVGTFRDAIQKLDYLAELGVNMVELLPICSMEMDFGWGYAPDYIYAVESLYGGRHGFLEFVKEAHRRGIGVILDVVYNHFSTDSSLDLWRFDGWFEDNDGLQGGGIYFYNDWRGETPWGARPDYGRAEVRQYLLDNVTMWLHDCHVDGLRVDSTIYIRNAKGYNDAPDTDLPDGWKLLQDITDLAAKIKPSALMIAEDAGANPYLTKPAHDGGAGFRAQWELGFPGALREALGSNDPLVINLTALIGELGRRYNDDTLQRVVFVDSHDTAANGSARFNEVIAPGKSAGMFARRQALLAATLLLTAPGIPMLLQGQEFMMGGSFTDWQGLDWALAASYAGIVEAYRRLIRLRKNSDRISAGLLGSNLNLFHVDEDNKVLAYHRWAAGGTGDDVIVVINFGDKHIESYGLDFPHDGTWKVRFNSSSQTFGADFAEVPVPDVQAVNGGTQIILPPATALIFSRD